MSDLIIKPYEVTVSGFMPATYFASTPGKARAAAWRDYNSGHDVSFREFLGLSSVRKSKPPPKFGERILVCGKPAYRVPGSLGESVRFVRPGSDVLMFSHPMDVSTSA